MNIPGRCVVWWAPDWTDFLKYVLTLEREVRTECLALGQTSALCKADAKEIQ